MPDTPTLTILQGGGTYIFQFQAGDAAAHPLVLVERVERADAQFQAQFAHAVRLLNERIPQSTQRTVRPDGQSAARADPLLGLGRMLCQHLIPPAIQRALREMPPGTPLHLATNAPELPWELLHDDQEYLAAKFALARQLVTDQPLHQRAPRSGHQLTALLIGNPTADLPETAEEIEQIVQLIESIPGAAPPRILMRRRATKEALLQELASGAYDLIHYSGHARFDAQNPANSGLVLAKNELLTVDDLQRNLGGRPFVFLNGCESGRMDASAAEDATDLTYLGTAARGMAAAFLHGGAAGFLGSVWPIHDAGSRAFALTFYRAALHGETVAAALRTARLAARQANARDPLWASFTLYGKATHGLPLPHRHQRRPATVLTVHLHGVESLFAQMHEEEAVRHVDELLAGLSARIAHYGGEVRMAAQDTLTGVFGLAGTHQNDAERAVRAALDLADYLQTQVESGATGLDFGIGISSGDIFVRSERHGDARVSTVLGRGVSHAAELARRGTGGAILAAQSVLQLVSHLLELATSPPAAEPPGDALQIVGLRQSERSQFTVDRHTMTVGRQAELALLEQGWRQCQRGRGQLIGLTGEAGIGKSHLLRAFHQRIGDDEAAWLMVSAPSAYTPRPYEILSQLVRHLLPPDPANAANSQGERSLRQRVEQALRHLPAPPLPDQQLREAVALLGDVLLFSTDDQPLEHLEHLDAQARQHRLVTVLGRLLSTRTACTPVILVLDDLHRADEASLDVLHSLVAGIDRLPLLLIAAFRAEDDWQPPWWNRRTYRQIHLDALDEEAGSTLIHALLAADAVPGDVVERLLTRCHGNPLFLRELVAALRESGALRRVAGQWRLESAASGAEIPGSVRRVLLSRIERLPQAAQHVLTIAAVMGNVVEQPLLQTLVAGTMDEAATGQALTELELRDFVYRSWGAEAIYFRHALVRDVAYAKLLVAERRRHHRQVGEMLAALDDGRHERIEQIAQHFFFSVTAPLASEQWDVAHNAEPAQLERAATWLIRAGDRARNTYAARDALRHYKRAELIAAALPDGATQRIDIYDGMGDAHQLIGEFDTAVACLQRALQWMSAVDPSGSVRRRRADFARRIGLLQEWKGDFAAAMEWLQRAVEELGEQTTADDWALAGAIQMRMGSVYFHRGELETAADACRTGLAFAERIHHRRVRAEGHNLLGTIYAVQGETDVALEHYRHSLRLWTQLEDAYQIARVEDNLGGTYLWSGDWDAARAHLERGYAFWDAIDNQYNLAFASLNLGLVALYCGEWAEADVRFRQALDIWSRADNQRWIALCHTNLGLLAIAQGDWSVARTHVETSRAMLQSGGIRDLLPEVCYALAEIELAAGHLDEAQRLARQAVALADELAMHTEHGVALRILGRALLASGDLIEARSALEESLSILTRVNNRYEMARTLVAAAELDTVQNEPERARAKLQRAVSLFEMLGAQPDLHAAGQRLAQVASAG